MKSSFPGKLLPNLVIYEIIKDLSFSDIKNIYLVHTKFRKIIDETDIWNRLLLKAQKGDETDILDMWLQREKGDLNIDYQKLFNKNPKDTFLIYYHIKNNIQFLGFPLAMEYTVADFYEVQNMTLEGGCSYLPEKMFYGLSNIIHLNLEQNNLITLSERVFSHLVNLTSLNLGKNNLKVLPEGLFHGLKKVNCIFLNNNLLSELPEKIFRNLSNLQIVDVKCNKISQLPGTIFHNLYNLEIINFQSNNIWKLPNNLFFALEKLETVIFADNFIEEIPSNIFYTNGKLKTLNFGNNSISKLSEELFTGKDNLEYVNFQNNKLLKIPETLISKYLNGSLYFNFQGNDGIMNKYKIPENVNNKRCTIF